MAALPLLRRVLLTLALLSAANAAQANPQLLIDATTMEVLYEEQAGQPWYPASLTKLMTAFVTFSAIQQGRVNLKAEVIMSRKAVSQPPSSTGLPRDSAVTLEDALHILIVKSANDIAVAIAETVAGSESAFVAEMNATAKQMGLTATHFVNPNGLHDPQQTTSARDLAVLALYIRQQFPQYLPIFATEAVTLNGQRMKTNNNLLTEFAGTTGMKTGYVCASGLNIVATLERGGRSLLAVVLGGSSGRERGEMTAQLFLRGLSGAAKGRGQSVVNLPNMSSAKPLDMRPLICGKEAKTYVAQRKAEFPLGLEGQPSYLNDEVQNGREYAAVNLGRIRDVQLPRKRPGYAPQERLAISIPTETTEPAENVDAGLVAPIPMPRLDRGA